MTQSLEILSDKINKLRTKSEKNKGRLEQIRKEKERILATLKSDFKVNSISEARKLVEANHLALQKREVSLQTIIGKLNKAMEGEEPTEDASELDF